MTALLGLALWAHSHWYPEAEWYTSGITDLSGVYGLGGIALLVAAVSGFVVTVVFPWVTQKAARSPIEITVGTNQLRFGGRGRYEHLSGARSVQGEDAYSDDKALIANPRAFKRAVESIINGLDTRAKPFVVITVELDGGASPSLADIHIIKSAMLSCENVLDFCVQGKA
ncbi:hypothetical protein [Marinobacter sp. P4B1]|uniref:hypothetical protein n=1 Tax=Marinobacter sp. P4B1 TaxID=1119533 RepID=UPI0011A66CFF|nr:hypothetical protein [Marinobacter sp. P4B1]